MLERYNWSKVVLAYKNRDHIGWSGDLSCNLFMSAGKSRQDQAEILGSDKSVFPVVNVFKKTKITYQPIDLSAAEVKYYKNDTDPIESNMTLIREQFLDKKSSIILTCLDPDTLRSLVLAAKRTGVLDTGQFVFFNFELGITNAIEAYKPWLDEAASVEENIEAREAFSSVLTVSAGSPHPQTENFTAFSRRVKDIAEEEFGYQFTEDVSLSVAKFYDAALLYTSGIVLYYCDVLYCTLMYCTVLYCNDRNDI